MRYARGLDAANFSPYHAPNLQQGAQKSDRFWLIHILSYIFNPIRSQLETVLDFWLVNVCINKCELIKGGHFWVTCCNIFNELSTVYIKLSSQYEFLRQLFQREVSSDLFPPCQQTPSFAYSIWSTQEGLCVNRERSLLSMCYMLLGYSFELRPHSRGGGAVGSALAIGL